MSEKKLLITEDGSHTIFVPELNETYHSTHGAIQESTYVFIHQGLQFFLEKRQKKLVNVFEVGFGTGLNALLSALFAAENEYFIQYKSIEAYPLEKSEIEQLNYINLIKNQHAKEIFDKIHTCSWEAWEAISPNFQLFKVNQKLQDYERSECYDVCLFDAFAPSKQPEMWRMNLLEKVYTSLVRHGIFVTYCAKGQLKRDLRAIGFQVETLPGPPGKKEMVRGIKI